MPICSKCKLQERLSYSAYCKPCKQAYERTWLKARPGYARKHQLKALYGLTLDQYEALGTECAVCGCGRKAIAFGNKVRTNLHVDHNHETNEVRGLLCEDCNRALGILREDPERIRALADYIEGALV